MCCCSTRLHRASQSGEERWTNLFGADLVHAIPRFLVVLDHVVKLVAEELPACANEPSKGSEGFLSLPRSSPHSCKQENAPSNTDDDDGNE